TEYRCDDAKRLTVSEVLRRLDQRVANLSLRLPHDHLAVMNSRKVTHRDTRRRRLTRHPSCRRFCFVRSAAVTSGLMSLTVSAPLHPTTTYSIRSISTPHDLQERRRHHLGGRRQVERALPREDGAALISEDEHLDLLVDDNPNLVLRVPGSDVLRAARAALDVKAESPERHADAVVDRDRREEVIRVPALVRRAHVPVLLQVRSAPKRDATGT